MRYMLTAMNRREICRLLLVLCGLVWSGDGWAQLATNPFRVEALPVAGSATVGQPLSVQVEITVPPDHYLYADATTLYFPATDDVAVRSIRYPHADHKEDAFFGKVVAIYPTSVMIEAEVLLRKPLDTLQATVTYQGCSQSICFRRMEVPLAWSVHVVSDGIAEPTAVPADDALPHATAAGLAPMSATWTDFLANPTLDGLTAQNAGVAYVLSFIGGILTSFTPCVLPMIPVILLIVGIQPGLWRRNLWLSTCLSLGVACTAAATGVIAAVIGLPLSFIFQQRWFVVLVIILFVLMALSMFGLFTVRLPYAVQNRLQHLGGKGPRGAFLAGVSTGLLATPCAGPVVAALVAYVGVSGNVLYGFSLLLTYGVGFALIFILVGTFYGQLAGRLPHGGAIRAVKMVLGLLLLLPAGYYVWVLTGTSARGWMTDPQAAYAEARTTGRPLLIEFTAKSCPPCIVMEQTTFRNAAVLHALRHDVVPLRLDMTFPTDERLALADRYGVVGWPAILLATPDGDIFPDLSMIGKIIAPEQLLAHIAKATSRVEKAAPQ